MEGIRRIFVMGPPGSGKSTASLGLALHLGCKNIGVGEILRNLNGAEAIEAEIMRRQHGKPSSEFIVRILAARVDRNETFVLDGYSPNGFLDSGFMPTDVIILEVPDKLAVARQIERAGRPSDTDHKYCQERVREYKIRTPGILATYPDDVRYYKIAVSEADTKEVVLGRVIAALTPS